jgi:hypothetical protein
MDRNRESSESRKKDEVFLDVDDLSDSDETFKQKNEMFSGLNFTDNSAAKKNSINPNDIS